MNRPSPNQRVCGKECEDGHTDAAVGLAFSGGGYRAMISGAGGLWALVRS